MRHRFRKAKNAGRAPSGMSEVDRLKQLHVRSEGVELSMEHQEGHSSEANIIDVTRKTLPIRGFVNECASCFVNAVLQDLVNVDAFCDAVRSIGSASVRDGRCSMVNQFLDLLKAHDADGDCVGCIQPRSVMGIELGKPPYVSFAPGLHHDAHEWLITLLNHACEPEDCDISSAISLTCLFRPGLLSQSIAVVTKPLLVTHRRALHLIFQRVMMPESYGGSVV